MKLSLQPLLEAYRSYKGTTPFFNNFFIKLSGTAELENQIKAGLNEEEIRQTWQDGLDDFRKKRKKYLLYQDFE